ncbi:TcdA/TcdB pore-forming domain-containing protein [Aeromonas jandaei]|uniref:TcdA/TcdB pore-forming domain-containing protein n=1 Tax=Aeromonas jandaei TaxID=650 RepID=UPI002AA0CDB5|nr:TcdA/TcdB pore-forming domain-containing protein [Aeromonas jandaei]
MTVRRFNFNQGNDFLHKVRGRILNSSLVSAIPKEFAPDKLSHMRNLVTNPGNLTTMGGLCMPLSAQVTIEEMNKAGGGKEFLTWLKGLVENAEEYDNSESKNAEDFKNTLTLDLEAAIKYSQSVSFSSVMDDLISNYLGMDYLMELVLASDMGFFSSMSKTKVIRAVNNSTFASSMLTSIFTSQGIMANPFDEAELDMPLDTLNERLRAIARGGRTTAVGVSTPTHKMSMFFSDDGRWRFFDPNYGLFTYTSVEELIPHFKRHVSFYKDSLQVDGNGNFLVEFSSSPKYPPLKSYSTLPFKTLGEYQAMAANGILIQLRAMSKDKDITIKTKSGTFLVQVDGYTGGSIEFKLSMLGHDVDFIVSGLDPSRLVLLVEKTFSRINFFDVTSIDLSDEMLINTLETLDNVSAKTGLRFDDVEHLLFERMQVKQWTRKGLFDFLDAVTAYSNTAPEMLELQRKLSSLQKATNLTTKLSYQEMVDKFKLTYDEALFYLFDKVYNVGSYEPQRYNQLVDDIERALKNYQGTEQSRIVTEVLCEEQFSHLLKPFKKQALLSLQETRAAADKLFSVSLDSFGETVAEKALLALDLASLDKVAKGFNFVSNLTQAQKQQWQSVLEKSRNIVSTNKIKQLLGDAYEVMTGDLSAKTMEDIVKVSTVLGDIIQNEHFSDDDRLLADNALRTLTERIAQSADKTLRFEQLDNFIKPLSAHIKTLANYVGPTSHTQIMSIFEETNGKIAMKGMSFALAIQFLIEESHKQGNGEVYIDWMASLARAAEYVQPAGKSDISDVTDEIVNQYRKSKAELFLKGLINLHYLQFDDSLAAAGDASTARDNAFAKHGLSKVMDQMETPDDFYLMLERLEPNSFIQFGSHAFSQALVRTSSGNWLWFDPDAGMTVFANMESLKTSKAFSIKTLAGNVLVLNGRKEYIPYRVYKPSGVVAGTEAGTLLQYAQEEELNFISRELQTRSNTSALTVTVAGKAYSVRVSFDAISTIIVATGSNQRVVTIVVEGAVPRQIASVMEKTLTFKPFENTRVINLTKPLVAKLVDFMSLTSIDSPRLSGLVSSMAGSPEVWTKTTLNELREILADANIDRADPILINKELLLQRDINLALPAATVLEAVRRVGLASSSVIDKIFSDYRVHTFSHEEFEAFVEALKAQVAQTSQSSEWIVANSLSKSRLDAMLRPLDSADTRSADEMRRVVEAFEPKYPGEREALWSALKERSLATLNTLRDHLEKQASSTSQVAWLEAVNTVTPEVETKWLQNKLGEDFDFLDSKELPTSNARDVAILGIFQELSANEALSASRKAQIKEVIERFVERRDLASVERNIKARALSVEEIYNLNVRINKASVKSAQPELNAVYERVKRALHDNMNISIDKQSKLAAKNRSLSEQMAVDGVKMFADGMKYNQIVERVFKEHGLSKTTWMPTLETNNGGVVFIHSETGETRAFELSREELSQVEKLRVAVKNGADALKNTTQFDPKSGRFTEPSMVGDVAAPGTMNAAFTFQLFLMLSKQGGFAHASTAAKVQTIASITQMTLGVVDDVVKFTNLVETLKGANWEVFTSTPGALGKGTVWANRVMNVASLVTSIIQLGETQDPAVRAGLEAQIGVFTAQIGVDIAATLLAGSIVGEVLGEFAAPLAAIGIGIVGLVENYTQREQTFERSAEFFDALMNDVTSDGITYTESVARFGNSFAIDTIDLNSGTVKYGQIRVSKSKPGTLHSVGGLFGGKPWDHFLGAGDFYDLDDRNHSPTINAYDAFDCPTKLDMTSAEGKSRALLLPTGVNMSIQLKIDKDMPGVRFKDPAAYMKMRKYFGLDFVWGFFATLTDYGAYMKSVTSTHTPVTIKLDNSSRSVIIPTLENEETRSLLSYTLQGNGGYYLIQLAYHAMALTIAASANEKEAWVFDATNMAGSYTSTKSGYESDGKIKHDFYKTISFNSRNFNIAGQTIAVSGDVLPETLYVRVMLSNGAGNIFTAFDVASQKMTHTVTLSSGNFYNDVLTLLDGQLVLSVGDIAVFQFNDGTRTLSVLKSAEDKYRYNFQSEHGVVDAYVLKNQDAKKADTLISVIINGSNDNFLFKNGKAQNVLALLEVVFGKTLFSTLTLTEKTEISFKQVKGGETLWTTVNVNPRTGELIGQTFQAVGLGGMTYVYHRAEDGRGDLLAKYPEGAAKTGRLSIDVPEWLLSECQFNKYYVTVASDVDVIDLDVMVVSKWPTTIVMSEVKKAVVKFPNVSGAEWSWTQDGADLLLTGAGREIKFADILRSEALCENITFEINGARQSLTKFMLAQIYDKYGFLGRELGDEDLFVTYFQDSDNRVSIASLLRDVVHFSLPEQVSGLFSLAEEGVVLKGRSGALYRVNEGKPTVVNERDGIWVADINGDGVEELVVLDKQGLSYVIDGKKQLISDYKDANGWGDTNSNTIFVADFNGDGRSDVVAFSQSQVYYNEGQRDGSLGGSSTLSGHLSGATRYRSFVTVLKPGDSVGLVSLLRHNFDGLDRYAVRVSADNGFTNYTANNPEEAEWRSLYRAMMEDGSWRFEAVLDSDGDGIKDIYFIGEGGRQFVAKGYQGDEGVRFAAPVELRPLVLGNGRVKGIKGMVGARQLEVLVDDGKGNVKTLSTVLERLKPEVGQAVGVDTDGACYYQDAHNKLSVVSKDGELKQVLLPEPVQKMFSHSEQGAILQGVSGVLYQIKRGLSRVVTERDGIWVADMDGDGTQELVVLERGGLSYTVKGEKRVVANFRTDKYIRDEDDNWSDSNRFSIFVKDINGDGRADIIGFGQFRMYYYFSREDGSVRAGERYTAKMGVDTWKTVSSTELNDGQSRLLCVGEVKTEDANSYEVRVSYGDSGYYVANEANSKGWKVLNAAMTAKGGWQFKEMLDYDGDGMMDLFFAAGDGRNFVSLGYNELFELSILEGKKPTLMFAEPIELSPLELNRGRVVGITKKSGADSGPVVVVDDGVNGETRFITGRVMSERAQVAQSLVQAMSGFVGTERNVGTRESAVMGAGGEVVAVVSRVTR